jgi:hypothetical protein
MAECRTKTGAQQGESSSDAPEKADNHYGNV